MRAATAQRCFNPAGGRLSSLSRLRAPCKPPGQPLSPLSCSMRLSPGFGGFSKPPWVAVPGAQPQSGPRSSSHVGSLGCRLPPCGAGVAQGWQVACGGKERFKQLLSWAHTLFWEELDACKYSQGALWGGEGSTGVASSRVCVCGVCVHCLPARCKSCLWLQRCFVWIYRAMLVAGSPAPSPWTLFKDFPFQLRPASSCHRCSMCPHRPGSAPRSASPCWKQEALAPGKLFKLNSKQ